MKINLSDAKKIRALTGFGASACWWSPQIKDDKTADEVIDLLYGNNGLKLNIYRYNAGGGFDVNNVRVNNAWRVIESFMNEDGSYNWNADKHAVSVMKKALDTGNVDTLIFFANSPHYTQTITGQASGGLTEHFSNLDKTKYDEFAKYFIDIAEHFVEEGYPVKYISPINEPQWKWGGDYVWQEGCHYEPQEVRDCFLAFAKELERRKSSLLLYGMESGDLSDKTKEYYALLEAEPLIMKYLDTFAYHSYHSDNDVKSKVDFGKWAKENVKTKHFDMSEWCELPCRHDTKSIDSTLIMARIIGEDLIYTGVNSWTAWVAVNQLGKPREDGLCFSDGLLVADDSFENYYIAMRYYALAHFSKYIPVGSVSLDIGFNTSRGFSLFAFRRPDKKMVLVAVNYSRAKRVIEADIDIKNADIIITTQENQLEHKKSQSDKIAIPPMSIATIII